MCAKPWRHFITTLSLDMLGYGISERHSIGALRDPWFFQGQPDHCRDRSRHSFIESCGLFHSSVDVGTSPNRSSHDHESRWSIDGADEPSRNEQIIFGRVE